MKRILQLLTLSLFVFVAVSCSHGAKAIDKAFDQACEANSPEKVAMTLCNGDIKCSTLTSDEIAKLGAVLGYITYTGLYTANFQDQVDMYEFGKLLDGYREVERSMTGEDRNQMEKYLKDILVNQPGLPSKE